MFSELAKDSGLSSRTLHECVQFYRCYPIVRTSAQLTRSHYLLLCRVSDVKQRITLTAEAIKGDWTVAQLTTRVRALNAATNPLEVEDATMRAAGRPKLLTSKRGTPGVCRVIADGESLAMDLGFACHPRMPEASGLRLNDFVNVTKAGVAKLGDAAKADLFTYNAEILKVVDSDTLWVRIFLRPDQWVKQKLRLRGLDCPEMSTPEGKAAKRFVDALVHQAERITISTTKPDKYDRYLADVILVGATDQSSDLSAVASAKAEASAKEDVFLNNALLGAGHAVTKNAWEFGNWGLEG